MEELEEFLQSSEYIQGIQNNTTGNATAKPTSGLIPEEDKTINDWKGSGATVSYVPWQGLFNARPADFAHNCPYAGNRHADAFRFAHTDARTAAHRSHDVPVTNESGNSGLVVFIVIAVVLLLGGGGFAFMQYQKKQREVAMKAAQRRAQAARNADRPVARQAGQPQQMRAGAYATPQQRPQTNNGVSPVQVRPATPVPQTQDMQKPTASRLSHANSAPDEAAGDPVHCRAEEHDDDGESVCAPGGEIGRGSAAPSPPYRSVSPG